MRLLELKPVVTTLDEFKIIQKQIRDVLKKLVYLPLLKELELPADTIQNAKAGLLKALQSGRLTFSRGQFKGKLSAATTKELRALGAVWDKKTATFRLPLRQLPEEIQHAIVTSEARFLERLGSVDRKLAQILPEEIAGRIQVADLFDSALWKTNRQLESTLKGITVPPQLTDERRRRIAEEWQENMDLWIKNFAEEEIAKLRKDIKKSTFAGSRYEAAIRSVQRSYGVTERKARFLARQETNLLLTKFKESRYTDSGVPEYRWRCVAGSKLHPVRPSHKKLDGKIFRWDTPPITTAPNEPTRRNNPGQDFGCRCAAIPIVKFREKPS